MRQKSSWLALPLFVVAGVVVAGVVVAGVVVAQEADTKAKVDPSGTWKWDVDFGGNNIDHTLVINANEGKVTGNYKTVFENAPENAPPGLSDPVKIDEGKVDGDNISFSVTRSFGGNDFTIEYDGVIAGDEIAGASTMDFGGEEREFEWVAKRVVRDEDVIGKWKLKFTIPQGDIEDELTLVRGEDDKKLTGTYHSSHLGEHPIKDAKLKDKELSFAVELENDGVKIVAMFDVKPRGDKLDGMILTSFGDQEIKTLVTGIRSEATSRETPKSDTDGSTEKTSEQ